jgi:hypothetical protein
MSVCTTLLLRLNSVRRASYAAILLAHEGKGNESISNNDLSLNRSALTVYQLLSFFLSLSFWRVDPLHVLVVVEQLLSFILPARLLERIRETVTPLLLFHSSRGQLSKKMTVTEETISVSNANHRSIDFTLS